MENKVREIRISKKIGFNEMCEKANISRRTLWLIEKNKQSVIKSETMMKLANAMDCKITDIFLF